MIARRTFLTASLAMLATGAARAQTPGPLAWIVQRGAGRAFIMGHADAPDDRWLTPTIRAAFEGSTELWVETPPFDPSAPAQPSPLIRQLGFEANRSLFDVLGPALSERTRALAASAGVDVAQIAPMRPWLAHYVLATAHRSRSGRPAVTANPEQALIRRARERSIPIRSEYATGDDLLRFFAAMPDEVQRQHMQNLLDYLDDERNGRHARNDGWVTGQPNTGPIDRMRIDTPALYEVMHVRRNAWWARRIADLVREGRRPFVMLGLNHVLGPHSVPRELARRDVPIRRA